MEKTKIETTKAERIRIADESVQMFVEYSEIIRGGGEVTPNPLDIRSFEILELAKYAIEHSLDGVFFMERVEEIRKGREAYPTENGIAICPLELDLPPSKLNLNNAYNYNNHHNCWTEYKFGKSILFKMFRKLESNQFALPIDTHKKLHEIYAPPEIPTPFQAMYAFDEAASRGDRLKTGSVQAPKYQKIDEKLYQEVFDCYEKIAKSS